MCKEKVIAAVDDHLQQLEGGEEFHVECGTSAAGFDVCNWETTIELDEPAYLEGGDLLVLPGFQWECPECSQPWEFRIDGVGVSRLD